MRSKTYVVDTSDHFEINKIEHTLESVDDSWHD